MTVHYHPLGLLVIASVARHGRCRPGNSLGMGTLAPPHCAHQTWRGGNARPRNAIAIELNGAFITGTPGTFAQDHRISGACPCYLRPTKPTDLVFLRLTV